MPTVKLILDQRRSKKDGSYPLKLKIYHEEKSVALGTHMSINGADWDTRSQVVKKSHPEHEYLNFQLAKLKHDVLAKLRNLTETNPDGFSFSTLRSYLKPGVNPAVIDHKTGTVKSYWEEHIARLSNAKQFGNMRVHKITMEVLSKEVDLDIPFETITYSFLKDLELSLLKRNLKTNTISVYLRTLRAIYNQAINHDLVPSSSYPFRKFKIRSEQVVPNILTVEDLKNLFELRLPPDDVLYKSWLIAKLSFLLGGINFTDLCHLRTDNIKNGRVVYTRSKTKKLYSILLLPESADILSLLHRPNSDTLLNILSKEDFEKPERIPFIIRDKNKQFNKKLLMDIPDKQTPLFRTILTPHFQLPFLCSTMLLKERG